MTVALRPQQNARTLPPYAHTIAFETGQTDETPFSRHE